MSCEIAILCEKPVQGKAIALALSDSAVKRGSSYRLSINGSSVVVVWSIGHITSLSDPEAYSEKYKRWRLEDLPIIPRLSQIKREVNPKQFKHLQYVVKILEGAGRILVATDRDREGELIAREILSRCNLSDSTQLFRVPINALDDVSIRSAFKHLTPHQLENRQASCAQMRAIADWLLGLNLTRLYSLVHGDNITGNSTIHIGRVSTPTLYLVWLREAAISAFVPHWIYQVKATFGVGHLRLSGEWVCQSEEVDDRGRCLSQREQQTVLHRCTEIGTARLVSHVSETKRTGAPLPYDLNTLQSKAIHSIGCTAKDVQSSLQSLYERHGLITYPRTESRYLPSSSKRTVGLTVEAIRRDDVGAKLAVFVSTQQLDQRVFDDQKVHANHHAIIPTSKSIDRSVLSPLENKLYDLIARSYLAQFAPPCIEEHSLVTLSVGHERFECHDKRIGQIGWRAITQGKYDGRFTSAYSAVDERLDLSHLDAGDTITLLALNAHDYETSPPRAYSEGSLLSAMKNLPRESLNGDHDAIKQLAGTGGIGTAATRAEIVFNCLQRDYLVRDTGTSRLQLTERGRQLLLLVDIAIKSPLVTALWESDLESIEIGRMSEADFYKKVASWVRDIVEKSRNHIDAKDSVNVPRIN
ncbi:DNA topoisomerase [uncultured Umboniibacter sp.]|uniref:DNA topoisomerase n=1 Tax=uncultured Umboniibacter sp. TaxID=1798917 RepID=UPI00261E3321|nr:DNA topoisomerase [uncultured Umboniibacter sp.]